MRRQAIAIVTGVILIELVSLAAWFLQRSRRRHIEESLRTSEERISLAALPDNLGLWQWDARENAIWATAHLRTILEIPRTIRLTPETVRARVHPEDRPAFEAAFNCGNGQVLDCDFRTVRASGEVRWITGKARASRNPSGRLQRVTGIVIDITDRVRAESECQHQRSQLAHLTRVAILGQLSGALAHELAQPLTAILSNAQAGQRFLSADELDVAELRDILDDIVSDDKRAGEVIQRLRGLLKRGEIQMQRFDVSDAIVDALAVAHGELAVRGVQVESRFEENLPAIHGDRVQIQQVLLNLLLNAADAMATNAPLDRKIGVSVARDRGGVRISVSDCGYGIADSETENIFDAFYTTKTHGLGLGLSICRSIAAAHGGQLWVSPNADRGSTFHFTIPERDAARVAS